MPPAFVNRLRSNSIPLNTIPPQHTSADYSPELATLAASILYRSPLPSPNDLPIFILNSAAFPDAKQEYYDELLPYVLARLPEEEDLIGGLEYEIVFFAGGNPGGSYGHRTTGGMEDEDEEDGVKDKTQKRPGFSWFMRAYNVLSRATRKRLKKLWIVHEKRWVRVIMEMFATVVSPKFRKKAVHLSTMTALALHLPIEDLLIPPSAYFTDRKKLPDIYVPYASGKRAFGVQNPFPLSADKKPRLPRLLREATSFLLHEDIIKTEGLFRISARQQTVEVVREAYERGQKFIIWKDGDTTMTFSPHREGFGDVVVDSKQLEQMEGYDAHTAAALIKLWYKELKEPLFPTSSYQALQRYYGSQDSTLDVNEIFTMLEPGVEYSILDQNARTILKTHLLPFLSLITSHSEINKMTPYNLAVCFAAVLLHGPDPMEDMKMTAIIRKILALMIEKWSSELAPALGLSPETFLSDLRPPSDPREREDPLESTATHTTSNVSESQISGITLLDNSSSSSSDVNDDDLRPPLPPRPARTITLPAASALPAIDPVNNVVQRKPAPALQVPPRYSSIVTDQAATLAHISSLEQAPPLPRNTVEDDFEVIDHPGHSGSSNGAGEGGHRDSIATITTLPAYEETATPLPLRQRTDSEGLGVMVGSAMGSSAGVWASLGPGSDRRITSPDTEQGQRSVSVGSIPRKPVGEGKGSKKEQENGDGG